ncbi:MAG TPA: hypothetical protein VJ761_24625 [Ktedonobacteraceae bacterium]|nr:hypothetical protein [Ktedonobacteraceae bacterium]
MNNFETPVKESEQPPGESSIHPEPSQPGIGTPVINTQSSDGSEPGPVMPPTFVPGTPPVYMWPNYYPGVRPQWTPGNQFAPRYRRRNSAWPWLVVSFVLLFMLLIGGLFAVWSIGTFANVSSVTETRHFAVSANPTLIINNDTGSLHVRAGSSASDVTIQATRHSGLWGNANDITVSYAQDTEGNTITVNVGRTSGSNIFTTSSVDFDVAVPSSTTLQLKTNTGSIDVSGISGQMVLTSNTGSITANNGAASGNTQLITNTGSVTFNGSIASSGTYQFQTNTGSVNVALPGDSNFHVEASTDTGTISTNFSGVNVHPRQFTGVDAQGVVGNAPGATVTLRTNTGSINLYHE